MANYFASARTNYFRVKDQNAFDSWLKSVVGVAEVVKDKEGRIALLFEEGIPSLRMLPDGEVDDANDFYFMKELSEHLANGEVAIAIESGAEKLRYVNGNAVAVNSNGKAVSISTDDIYSLAEKKLGGNITRAEY